MTTLAIELAASRLLGPAFGTSNLVWASIIGLILIYLTVGYFVGGRLADRSPEAETMYLVMAWGAFTSGLVPAVAQPVLRVAAAAFDEVQFGVVHVGVLFGSFAAVLILFSIPVTLLGTISPFAIRLAIQDPSTSGAISGRIYAISTLGSFIGTFLPTLLLVPLVGTNLTFGLFSLFLNLVALVGLWLAAGWRRAAVWAWMPVVLVILSLWVVRSPLKTSTGQVYETESAYNYIEVIEANGYRLLRLNEGQGIHSIYHPDQLLYNGPWEQFLAGPFYNQPPYTPAQVQSIAIVGLAAGTTARQATAVFGPIPIDGYEIDPEIIRVGQEYFGMTMPNLTPIAQDGRIGLTQSTKRYTLIAVDAYRPPYIPWHLTSREFFQVTYDHLTVDGVLAINVGRSPNDRRLIDGLASTLQDIFPSVYVMDIPDTYNSLVYATVQPTQELNLLLNYDQVSKSGALHPVLIEVLQRAIVYHQPTPPKTVVYTDDLAPIEWITNNMILNFMLSGEFETQ
jgi:spermidine synthase